MPRRAARAHTQTNAGAHRQTQVHFQGAASLAQCVMRFLVCAHPGQLVLELLVCTCRFDNGSWVLVTAALRLTTTIITSVYFPDVREGSSKCPYIQKKVPVNPMHAVFFLLCFRLQLLSLTVKGTNISVHKDGHF
jgi:hypothetical protein